MASRLQDVILRGLAADKPLATEVAPGTLYYSTDAFTTERCANDGLSWEDYTDASTGAARIGEIVVTVDNGAAVITTGLKGWMEITFPCNILAVTLLSDVSGSIVFDIWKDTYANYPPTVADTICAAAKPTISANNKSQDTTLTGWTTSIAGGDILAFNVDSVSSIKKVTMILKIEAV